MNILKFTLIVLPMIEIAIFIWLLIRMDRKQKKDNPVVIDDELGRVVMNDGPGHYDEVEYAERPFIEYFN